MTKITKRDLFRKCKIDLTFEGKRKSNVNTSRRGKNIRFK